MKCFYQKDEDWVAEAAGVGTEIGAIWLAGELLLALAPAGWIVLTGAAIAEGVALTLGGERLKDWIEIKTKWAEGYITKWM